MKPSTLYALLISCVSTTGFTAMLTVYYLLQGEPVKGLVASLVAAASTLLSIKINAKMVAYELAIVMDVLRQLEAPPSAETLRTSSCAPTEPHPAVSKCRGKQCAKKDECQ